MPKVEEMPVPIDHTDHEPLLLLWQPPFLVFGGTGSNGGITTFSISTGRLCEFRNKMFQTRMKIFKKKKGKKEKLH